MSTPDSQRFSKRDAEHLLDGGLAGPPALVDLLRTAVSPPSAAELSGEQRALAALRAAHLTPAPTSRSRSMIKSALAAMAAAKVATAAAVAAAAATGGLALAAATGHLPGPLQHAAHSAFSAPDTRTAEATDTPQATGSDTPTDTGSSTDTSTDSASAAATPSSQTPNPSLIGLCHAYDAGVADSHGKALDNPAFTVLITTAGGKDNVASYCSTLLASVTHDSRTPEPSESEHGAPSTHPGGEPSDVPSQGGGRPSSVPAGGQSTHADGGGSHGGGPHGGEPTPLPTPTGS